MSKLNRYGYGTDGNIIGRVGAIAVLAAAGFGLHRLNCGDGEMCEVMQTESCCSMVAGAGKAGKAPKAAAVPSVPAK